MKTLVNIALFAVLVFAAQACGSKSKNAEARLDAAPQEMTAEEKAAQEKREVAERRHAAQLERSRIAAEKRDKESPFYKDNDGDFIYNKSEVAPEFPGGQKDLSKYLRENLKYPEEAQSNGVEGTVFVEFVVAKDGSIRATTVSDETDPDIDPTLKEEAVKVVNNMPKWTPGRQMGKPVKVKFSLPVAFRLG